MAMDLSSVLHALPHLDPADLQQISSKAKALLTLSGSTKGASVLKSSAPSSDYLLEGIHYELRRRGLIGPRDRIPERAFPSSYVEASYAARRSLEARLPDLSSVEKVALGQLAAECLASWLETCHVQVRPKSMLLNVNNVSVGFDAAYPGYLEDGIFPPRFCWRGKRR